MIEMSRRRLLSMIGTIAGSTAMYHAMTGMGHAQASSYSGPIQLDGSPQGTKILVLGAGLAGMTAALELRAAGYEVEVLEFREKAGGLCWTLRSGDTYAELGGATQNVDFAEGNYINPHDLVAPGDGAARLPVADRGTEGAVRLQPGTQRRRAAAERERGKDHERRRGQERQQHAQGAEAERREAHCDPREPHRHCSRIRRRPVSVTIASIGTSCGCG